MRRFWAGFNHWWHHGIELQTPHRDIKGMIALIDSMETNRKEEDA